MRQRILAGCVVSLTACLSIAAPDARAAAPQVKTQAPGYYRMMLGDFEVTALSDGTFALKVGEVITGGAPKEIETALARSFLGDTVEESVNAFLVNTGSKLVLIDTGAGAFFGSTTGKLLVSLEASGYRPDQVDEIYITHMHGDHIGGLLVDGKAAFPRAIVRVDRKEADFWLSKSNRDAAPKDAREDFEQAMAAFQPYISSGRLKTFTGDTALLPGFRAVPAPGHTPGHTVYRVQSRGETLVLWGDTMHVAALQFPDPSLTDNYDADTAAGIAERKKIFADVAAQRDWVAGAHLSFPGIGHLRASGGGYVYVHANYTAMQGATPAGSR